MKSPRKTAEAGSLEDQAAEQQTKPALPRIVAAPPRLAALSLLLLVLIVYAPGMGNGFIWDDDLYLTNNPIIWRGGVWDDIWFDIHATPQYYPLVYATFKIEYLLWGFNPIGFHLTNILLHGLGAVLFWMLLRRLRFPGAWLAAAIFAAHPVHVESVIWITERKNVLSLVFYLAALLCYFQFHAAAGRSRRALLYALTFGLFVCALWSKTVTCSLPVAILLLQWLRTGRIARADVVATLPLFAVGLGLGLLTAWHETANVGAQGTEWSLTLIQRCLIAARAPWFYLDKLLWPHPLIFSYPRWEIDPANWRLYLYPAADLALVLLLWFLRGRIGRAPLAAAVFYVSTLFPALSFFDIYTLRYTYVADHYQYHASLGPIALFAAGTAMLLRRLNWLEFTERPDALELYHGGRRTAGPLLCAALLLPLCLKTALQTRIYRDAETLWRATLADNPASWLSWHNLGESLAKRGEYAASLEPFEKALALDPQLAEAHFCLALSRANLGHNAEALAGFAEAVRLKPDYAEAHNCWGNALAQLNRLPEAIEHYQAAIALDPRMAQAHNGLATAYLLAGKPELAIRHFGAALRLDPQYARAYFNLGSLYHQQKNPALAARNLAAAVEADPEFGAAHLRLAQVYFELGDHARSLAHCERALELLPAATEARELREKLAR